MSDLSTIVVAGTLAGDPSAHALAREVERVQHRYAAEVVGRFSLCPFMRDAQTAFGRFAVMLDTEPELESAFLQIASAGTTVVHIVYPLVTLEATPFERFGNQLHQLVAKRLAGAPVHATFHPRMEGDRSSAARIVGLLRRAPDPFIQFVPEGLHQGGTTYADPVTLDLIALVKGVEKGRAETLFSRLDEVALDEIEARQRHIRADRDASYAPFLEAMA